MYLIQALGTIYDTKLSTRILPPLECQKFQAQSQLYLGKADFSLCTGTEVGAEMMSKQDECAVANKSNKYWEV